MSKKNLIFGIIIILILISCLLYLRINLKAENSKVTVATSTLSTVAVVNDKLSSATDRNLISAAVTSTSTIVTDIFSGRILEAKQNIDGTIQYKVDITNDVIGVSLLGHASGVVTAVTVASSTKLVNTGSMKYIFYTHLNSTTGNYEIFKTVLYLT